MVVTGSNNITPVAGKPRNLGARRGDGGSCSPSRQIRRVDDESLCKKCEKIVKNQEKGVQCDACRNWMHKKCGEISNELYKAISEVEDIDWFCNDCKGRVKNSNREISKLVDENRKLNEENSALKIKLANLENRVRDLKEEIKHELLQEVKDSIRDMMMEYKEKDDKKDRECNLVLYNVEESNKENGRDREADDKILTDRVFKEGVGINEYQIKSIIRLGKRNEGINKPRPLLIKLDNSEQKWLILKNAKKLNKCTRQEFKKCFIVPDKTKIEREKDYLLRNQLKEERDSGEEGWYIKNGKLNRRNF